MFGRKQALDLLCHQENASLVGGAGKVFVVGPTGVGKSTFARALSAQGFLVHVEASGWLKERMVVPDGISARERAQMMSERARDILADDPNACVRWLEGQTNCCGGGITISGVRNPRDFALLFNPEVDVLVSLQREGIQICTEFERGIEVIIAHALWTQRVWHERRDNPLPMFMPVNLDLECVK